MLNLVIKADTLSLASLDDSQISCVTQREIESIAIDSTSVRISASIGLSVYPHDSASGGELLIKGRSRNV